MSSKVEQAPGQPFFVDFGFWAALIGTLSVEELSHQNDGEETLGLLAYLRFGVAGLGLACGPPSWLRGSSGSLRLLHGLERLPLLFLLAALFGALPEDLPNHEALGPPRFPKNL